MCFRWRIGYILTSAADLRGQTIRKILAIIVVLLTSVSLTFASQYNADENCTLDQEDLLDIEALGKDSIAPFTFTGAFSSTLAAILKREEQGTAVEYAPLFEETLLVKSRSQALSTHLMGTSPPRV